MLYIYASFILVMLIILSYLTDRKYPTQRRYLMPIFFMLMLIVASSAFFFSPIKPSILTAQQQQQVIDQQPKFARWYADYQKTIHHINHFTNAYERITQNYFDQQISAPEAKNQLDNLYEESNAFTKELDSWQPPEHLTKDNTLLTQGIIKTTKVYQYHVNETIRQSIVAIQTGIQLGLPHKDTVNNLVRIKAIEYPVLLNNAQYIYQIRENLTLIPEEKNNK